MVQISRRDLIYESVMVESVGYGRDTREESDNLFENEMVQIERVSFLIRF